MSDLGKSCEEAGVCTLPNIYCRYPDCHKGSADRAMVPLSESEELHTAHIALTHLREANRELVEALESAVTDMQDWAAYASSYFQEKHGIAHDVAEYRAIIAKHKEPNNG